MTKNFLAIAALLILAMCTPAPDVVGKWKAVEAPGSLEFHKNGSVEMVDNMGANFKGNYTISSSGDIKFTFTFSDVMSDYMQPMDEPETVSGKILIQDNALTLTSPDSGEVLTYRRS